MAMSFSVRKERIILPIALTVSTCLNPECCHKYVLLGVLGDGEVMEQNGGYYCPYCGSKFEYAPQNSE